MNGTRTMMSFSVAALLLGACQPQAAQFTDQDRSILTATFDSALTYFRAKNWKAWAGLYTEDGVLLPAHAPTLPAPAVLSGIVLATPGTTERVPFTGFFVMVTVTGSVLQFRSHPRSHAMKESAPDSADRVRLRT